MNPLFNQITPREKEVIALICGEGLTSKEAAARLGCGIRTIETHRERISQKLFDGRLAGVVKLTHLALARGWIRNLYANEPNG